MSRTTLGIFLDALVISAVGLWTSTLHAQAPTSAVSEDQATSGALTEIVVTATRRAELIKDIPFSVTALTGEELEARAVLNLSDFIQQVPGVMLVNRGAGANEITIRGLNANATQISSYQTTTVGYYLNDMPLSENPQAAGDVPLFDLQRVEVLRGPQGTLFGEGAPGGVIRYITNQPNLTKFEGAVAGQAFDYSHGAASYNGNLMLNAPLIDGKLAVRLVADYRNDGGFFDDYLGPTLTTVKKNANSSNTADVRLLVKWQATDQFDANFNFVHQKQNVGESNQSVMPNGQKMPGLENTDWVEWSLYNLTLNMKLPGVTLLSSSNYLTQTDFVFFALPAPAPFVQTQTQNEEIHNFIQEFRAVSDATDPLRWVLGAFYKDRHRDTGLPLNLIDLSGATPELPFFTIDDIRNDKEYAVYGEANYDFNKQFSIVLGGRYTHQKISYTTDQVDLAAFIFGFPTYTDIGSTSYNIFTPKASLLFHPTEDWNFYATIAKGFRGPGVKNFYTGGQSTYGAETVLTYEVGAKASLLNKRLSVALAVYYNDWSNMQIPLTFGAPWQSEITNAGKARTEGVELETRFAIDEHWQLGVSGAYAESKVLEYAVDPAAVGNQIGRDPKWTGSMFVDASYPITGLWKANGHADYTYIAARYDDIFNTPPELSSYGIYNARLGVSRESLDLYVFGRNLANKFATYTGSVVNGGYSILSPRAIGVGAAYRF
jgi:iron complex outermembrane receptor protein